MTEIEIESHGMLIDYDTGEILRPATADELETSLTTGDHMGAFSQGDRVVFVAGE